MNEGVERLLESEVVEDYKETVFSGHIREVARANS